MIGYVHSSEGQDSEGTKGNATAMTHGYTFHSHLISVLRVTEHSTLNSGPAANTLMTEDRLKGKSFLTSLGLTQLLPLALQHPAGPLASLSHSGRSVKAPSSEGV